MSAPKVRDPYYDELTRRYDENLERTLQQIRNEYHERESACNAGKKGNPGFTKFGEWGFVIGIGFGLYARFGLYIRFMTGLLIGFGLITALYCAVCAIRSGHRARLDEEIRQAAEERDQRLVKAREDSQKAREEEYNKYLSHTADIGVEFYRDWQRSGIDPRIFTWLGNLFDDVIRNACHERWREKISPSVTITVRNRTVLAQLSQTEYVEYNDDNKPIRPQPDLWKTEVFTFEHERMPSPVTSPDPYEAMCQRAGYARFLARYCSEMVPGVFPKDPNASGPVAPDARLEVTFSGAVAAMIYYAANTEFVP